MDDRIVADALRILRNDNCLKKAIVAEYRDFDVVIEEADCEWIEGHQCSWVEYQTQFRIQDDIIISDKKRIYDVAKDHVGKRAEIRLKIVLDNDGVVKDAYVYNVLRILG